MKVNLKRASDHDAEIIWSMQTEAFSALYKKYQDTDTSPATEPVEKILFRLQQPFTYYYLIECDHEIAGAIRVIDKKDTTDAKRISPIFILDKYRKKGIAQITIQEVEKIHGSNNWEVDTILQEKGLCYLYEKMGYQRTGKTEQINERLTLVFYKKD